MGSRRTTAIKDTRHRQRDQKSQQFLFLWKSCDKYFFCHLGCCCRVDSTRIMMGATIAHEPRVSTVIRYMQQVVHVYVCTFSVLRAQNGNFIISSKTHFSCVRLYGGESSCLKTAISFFMCPDESAPTKNWASFRRIVSSGTTGASVGADECAPVGRCPCLLGAAVCGGRFACCCLFFARLASASSAISTTNGTTDSIAALGSPCVSVCVASFEHERKHLFHLFISTDGEINVHCCEVLAGVTSDVLSGFYTVEALSSLSTPTGSRRGLYLFGGVCSNSSMSCTVSDNKRWCIFSAKKNNCHSVSCCEGCERPPFTRHLLPNVINQP